MPVPGTSDQQPEAALVGPSGPSTGDRLLVVEDSGAVRDLVSMTLRYEGFQVRTAPSGEAALVHAAEEAPDAAVIDVVLPDVSGFAVAQRLSELCPDVKILFLSARDDLQSKLRGLGLGEDYLTKPFEVDELVARVRRLLRPREVPRRIASGRAAQTVGYADLRVDGDSFEVARGGRRIPVTPTELRLLLHLVTYAEVVQPRAVLLREIWGVDGFDSRVLETYISYLRRKVDAGFQPLIHTVRSVGYVLRTDQG